MTFFERTNSVFGVTHKNNSFLISTPGYWSSRGGGETIHKLEKKLELSSQNDFELHVEEVRKRVNQIKIGDEDNKLFDFDTHKKEIIEEL